MIKSFIQKNILKTLLEVDLSSVERGIIEDSLVHKYVPAMQGTIFLSVLSIFPILFLETAVIVSVLIPITMVSGAAWFAISLANMKQKFERFGLELTADMFFAFSTSLAVLVLLAAFSLVDFFIAHWIVRIPFQTFFHAVSIFFGVIVITTIVYKIFIASFKYDINDAMLTGQSEAAEKFYRKSLSLLHTVADSLKQNKSKEVANYYIGVAFFEMYSYLDKIKVAQATLPGYIEKANTLLKNPSMSQVDADEIAYFLIGEFVRRCVNPTTYSARKSLQAISDEMECLRINTSESQEMVDTRLSIVFQEIADLIESQGETLFTKK